MLTSSGRAFSPSPPYDYASANTNPILPPQLCATGRVPGPHRTAAIRLLAHKRRDSKNIPSPSQDATIIGDSRTPLARSLTADTPAGIAIVVYSSLTPLRSTYTPTFDRYRAVTIIKPNKSLRRFFYYFPLSVLRFPSWLRRSGSALICAAACGSRGGDVSARQFYASYVTVLLRMPVCPRTVATACVCQRFPLSYSRVRHKHPSSEANFLYPPPAM
jgi:hypothetical protein